MEDKGNRQLNNQRESYVNYFRYLVNGLMAVALTVVISNPTFMENVHNHPGISWLVIFLVFLYLFEFSYWTGIGLPFFLAILIQETNFFWLRSFIEWYWDSKYVGSSISRELDGPYGHPPAFIYPNRRVFWIYFVPFFFMLLIIVFLVNRINHIVWYGFFIWQLVAVLYNRVNSQEGVWRLSSVLRGNWLIIKGLIAAKLSGVNPPTLKLWRAS